MYIVCLLALSSGVILIQVVGLGAFPGGWQHERASHANGMLIKVYKIHRNYDASAESCKKKTFDVDTMFCHCVCVCVCEGAAGGVAKLCA